MARPFVLLFVGLFVGVRGCAAASISMRSCQSVLRRGRPVLGVSSHDHAFRFQVSNSARRRPFCTSSPCRLLANGVRSDRLKRLDHFAHDLAQFVPGAKPHRVWLRKSILDQAVASPETLIGPTAMSIANQQQSGGSAFTQGMSSVHVFAANTFSQIIAGFECATRVSLPAYPQCVDA